MASQKLQNENSEKEYFCGDCWRFQNAEESRYNSIHENVKRCRIGNIVNAKVKSCAKLIRKKNKKK